MKSKAQKELEDIIHEEWLSFYLGERTEDEMDAFNKWVEQREEELDRSWELEYEDYDDDF